MWQFLWVFKKAHCKVDDFRKGRTRQPDHEFIAAYGVEPGTEPARIALVVRWAGVAWSIRHSCVRRIPIRAAWSCFRFGIAWTGYTYSGRLSGSWASRCSGSQAKSPQSLGNSPSAIWLAGCGICYRVLRLPNNSLQQTGHATYGASSLIASVSVRRLLD